MPSVSLLLQRAGICIAGILSLLLSAPAAAADEWPVWISDARLREVKQNIAAKKDPASAAFASLEVYVGKEINREPAPPKVWYVPGYYRDPQGHREAKQSLAKDADTAYALALHYRLTGDEKSARAAARLINAWPATLQELKTGDDSQLSFSYHFPAFIFAADLLRVWEGWAGADRLMFTKFVREKALPMNTMSRANNWGNWGLVLYLSGTAYVRDKAGFEKGVARWKEFIETQIAPDGSLPHEVGRNGGKGDYGLWYSHFTLLPQVVAAEIIRTSGTDVYDYQSSNGMTLKRAWETLIPWVKHPADFPFYKERATKGAEGQFRPDYIGYWEVLHTRWPDAEAKKLLEQKRPVEILHSAPFLTLTHGS